MTSRWAKWGLVFGVWTVLMLTASIQSYIWRAQRDMKPVWSEILAINGADYLFWALVTPPILFLAWRYPFRPGVWRKNLAVMLAAAGGLLLVHSLYKVPLYWWAYPDKFRGQTIPRMYTEQLGNFYDGLWMFCTIVLAAYVLGYYREMKERDLRASEMLNQLSKAQLQALKTQLQPHFLFNTLHAVTSLVHEDPARAETLLVRLSDLLRMSLENPLQEVPLREELEFLNLYLEIQTARFGPRLELEEKLDPNTMDAMLPSMILQPLVENAVRHAIEPRTGGGKIEISTTAVGNILRIAVKDDGPGLVLNGKRREGIGISNTRARLQHLYGEEHLFLMQNRSGGGCEVLVQIPLRLAPELEEGEVLEEAAYDVSNADRG